MRSVPTGLLLAALAQPLLAQGAPPQIAADQPYTMEYYYKVQWGHQQEFLQLFLKNHYPLLKKGVESGRMISVKIETPANHMTEDARWDYRVMSRVLESNRDAIIPAGIFRHVVGGRFNLYRNHAATLHALLEERVVVLQEQLQELLLVSPLHFVVVLHCVGLVGGNLWWSTLGEQGLRQRRQQQPSWDAPHHASETWQVIAMSSASLRRRVLRLPLLAREERDRLEALLRQGGVDPA